MMHRLFARGVTSLNFLSVKSCLSLTKVDDVPDRSIFDFFMLIRVILHKNFESRGVSLLKLLITFLFIEVIKIDNGASRLDSDISGRAERGDVKNLLNERYRRR